MPIYRRILWMFLSGKLDCFDTFSTEMALHQGKQIPALSYTGACMDNSGRANEWTRCEMPKKQHCCLHGITKF